MAVQPAYSLLPVNWDGWVRACNGSPAPPFSRSSCPLSYHGRDPLLCSNGSVYLYISRLDHVRILSRPVHYSQCLAQSKSALLLRPRHGTAPMALVRRGVFLRWVMAGTRGPCRWERRESRALFQEDNCPSHDKGTSRACVSFQKEKDNNNTARKEGGGALRASLQAE